MNESISRAAGAVHGQEMTPQAMERIIVSTGRLAAAAHHALRRCADESSARSFDCGSSEDRPRPASRNYCATWTVHCPEARARMLDILFY